MTKLSEARAVERSAAAHHERLCKRYDNGERGLEVALRNADVVWIRAKAAVAALEPADV